jgi:hypothetical protein
MSNAAAHEIETAQYRFRFAPSYTLLLFPIVLGVGAAVLIEAWRGQPMSWLEYVVVLAITFGVLGVGIYRGIGGARAGARSLGEVVLDEAGIRWHTGDGQLLFDVAWQELERAEIDRRQKMIVLVRDHGMPLTIGVPLEHGQLFRRAALERFSELTELLSRALPAEERVVPAEKAGPRRTMLIGVGSFAFAAALYFLNEAFAARFGLSHVNIYIPLLAVFVGVACVLIGGRQLLGMAPPDRSPRGRVQPLKLMGALGVLVLLDLALQLLTALQHGKYFL